MLRGLDTDKEKNRGEGGATTTAPVVEGRTGFERARFFASMTRCSKMTALGRQLRTAAEVKFVKLDVDHYGATHIHPTATGKWKRVTSVARVKTSMSVFPF